MTLDQARKIISEIKKRYGIRFSEYQEKEQDGELNTIYFTIKFKIDPPERVNKIS